MGIYLAIFYTLYTLLSWIILFRDERALAVYEKLYPHLGALLVSGRTLLLSLHLNTVPTALFAALVSGAFYFYYRALRCRISAKKILFFSFLFLGIVFFSYPVLSTDIFDYILEDRIVNVYHQNIWVTAPAAYPKDPFYQLASWQTTVNPYGPVNQFFYTLAGLAGGNSLLLSVITHKLVAIIFAAGFLILLFQTLSRFFPDRVEQGLVLVGWNPLFVWELAGSAHNDIIMLFCLLAGLYFYLGKKYLWAGLLLGAAVQAKFIAVVLAVFLFAGLVKELKRKPLITFTGAFLAANLTGLALLGNGLTGFLDRLVYGSGIYWQSLPMLLTPIIPGSRVIITAGFLIYFLWLLRRNFLGKEEPLSLYLRAILVYLLFVTTFYWNWYVLWGLVFIPLLPFGRLAKTFLLFSFTSLLAYAVYWGVLRLNPQSFAGTGIIYLLLAVPPALFYFYQSNVEKI